MLIYKLRRKTDGLFSTGCLCPYFTKLGKVWKSIPYIKTHLRQLKDPEVYAECEVVEYEITEKTIYPLDEVKKDLPDRADQVEIAYREKMQKRKKPCKHAVII